MFQAASWWQEDYKHVGSLDLVARTSCVLGETHEMNVIPSYVAAGSDPTL